VCCSVLQVTLSEIHEELGADLYEMRCIVLQCVAVCCSVVQCVAVCCSSHRARYVKSWGLICMRCVALCGIVVQCGALWCRVLQCVAVCCSVLQLTSRRDKS